MALRPTMPMVGGGLTADHVQPIVEAAGFDVMIGVGGAIQGHPDGPVAGGRAVMAAVDAAVREAADRPAGHPVAVPA
jgi:2,3-diketo-5-methylthiopentyl-1-phosphate enolase